MDPSTIERTRIDTSYVFLAVSKVTRMKSILPSVVPLAAGPRAGLEESDPAATNAVGAVDPCGTSGLRASSTVGTAPTTQRRT
jgi:hypothetical protein